ncbi:MAG: hypothetical protein WCI60_02910, partial [bacterium]
MENEDTPEINVEQDRVNNLASALHEDWRKTRLQEDGTFEGRVKPTKDEAWIAGHGTDQVDIANTEYVDLPEDWQAENKAAAEVIVGILSESPEAQDLSDEEHINMVGEKIHTAWLARNEWAKGGDLDVPFKDLPADEQAKDINQLKIALS